MFSSLEILCVVGGIGVFDVSASFWTFTARILFLHVLTLHKCTQCTTNNTPFHFMANKIVETTITQSVMFVPLHFVSHSVALVPGSCDILRDECEHVFREFSGFAETIFRFIHWVGILLLHTCTAYRMHFYSHRRYNIITQMDFLVKFYVTLIVDFCTEKLEKCYAI